MRLSLSLTELTESIYSKFDETQNRELLLKTPYVFSQEDYSKLAINAIDNIQKDKTKRDEFILASLSYYLREGKEHIPACIDKELRALEKQHFEEDDNPPAVSVYISFLKETGEQITGISDPKYMKALIKKAQEFNLKTLDEYLQFCDMEKKLLYFKGNEAIKDYIKEHTGATLTLNKDSELKKSLSEIINTCSTIVWHTKPKLVELENALGLIPL